MPAQLSPVPRKDWVLPEDDSEREFRFLQDLGRALHTYGGAAPQIEADLERCARAIGVEGNFSSTPTALFLTLEAPGGQRTALLRMEPGHVNSEKLSLLATLRDEVAAGTKPIDVASEEMAAICARPRRHGPVVVTIAGGFVCAAGTILMGGGWFAAAATMVLGTSITALHVALDSRRRFHGVLEPVAGVIVGAGAAGTAWLGQWLEFPVSPYRVSFAALLTLIPGLALTLGIRELVSRHQTSGTARLLGAAATILLLCVGVQIGARLVPALPDTVADPNVAHAWACEAGMGALTGVALYALFNARRRDIFAILVAVWVGHFGGRLGLTLLGAPLGAAVGALSVSLYSNIVARWRRQPASTTLIPGLILLLPSSFGFRSFEALLHGDITQGVEAAFQMFATAAAIVAGLLVASAVTPELSREKRWAPTSPGG